MHVKQWGSENINQEKKKKDEEVKFKALKFKISPNQNQIEQFKEWFDTYNYLYNQTIELFKKNNKMSFQEARNTFVTNETKLGYTEVNKLSLEVKELHKQKHKEKDVGKKEEILKIIDSKNIEKRAICKALKPVKNPNIKDWQLRTPKDIRAAAIQTAFDARKSAIESLKTKIIKKFELKFRKRKDNNCINIPSNIIKLENINGKYYFTIAPTYFDDVDAHIEIGKESEKNIRELRIQINNDCKLMKYKNDYYILIPVKIEKQKDQKEQKNNGVRFAGVDLGVRSFITIFGVDQFGNNTSHEVLINMEYISKLNDKIDLLKARKQTDSKRVRKRVLNRLEKLKDNYILEVHHKAANYLLNNFDIIFYGDIKSHDIVKNGKNKKLNRDINSIKFYQFKQYLLFKAKIQNKLVLEINEAYTTKTCSSCGTLNDPKCSKVYKCNNCNSTFERDLSAAKNMLMKGLFQLFSQEDYEHL